MSEDKKSTFEDVLNNKQFVRQEEVLGSLNKFAPGCRLEARDFDANWYPVRVKDVDESTREVLVHFEKWSSKFDEWIPMDSNRLRSVKQAPSLRGFAAGDLVMAMWNTQNKYPARIQRKLPDGRYEVLFDDGFTKRLPQARIWMRTPADKVFENVLGSKQDRRERKRKHNVAELFKSNKRVKKKTENESPKPELKASKKTDSVDSPKPEVKGNKKADKINEPVMDLVETTPEVVPTVEEPIESQLDEERESTSEATEVVPEALDVKSPTKSKKEPLPILLPKESSIMKTKRSSTDNHPSTDIEVEALDGTIQIWARQLTRRMEGKTAGKIEVVFCSPQGKKMRSRNEVIRFCQEHKVKYDPRIFNFSAKGRPKRRHSRRKTAESVISPPTPVAPPIETPVEVPNTPPSVPQPSTSTAVTPQPSASATVTAATLPTPQVQLPPSIPVLLSPHSSTPITTAEVLTEESKSIGFIGDLEVVVQGGQFICPISDCRKHFRKENLLHMHMKHYHPDLSKYLEHTPSVHDLAYARTAGGGSVAEASSPPLRANPRRSLEAKRSPYRPNAFGRLEVKLSAKNETVASELDRFVEEPLPLDKNLSLSSSSSETKPALLEPPPAETVQIEEKVEEPAPVANYTPEVVPEEGLRLKRKVQLPLKFAANIVLNLQDQKSSHESTFDQMLIVTESADEEPKSEDPGGIVQRNPILNTLLSSRPAAMPPTLKWRPPWRRTRRVARYHRHRGFRRPPPPPPALPPPLPQETVIPEAVEEIEIPPQPIIVETPPVSSISLEEQEKLEKLRRHEIINCICHIKEEDGLMIQCDICLCWQHGHCLGISRQSNVPETYICKVCKDPPKGRSSRLYRNHQEWIKKGILPSLPFTNRSEEAVARRKALLKRSFDLSGQLALLTRLLHSLRTKVSIATPKDHPKLWLWAHKDSDTSHEIKTEEDPGTPKVPEPEKPIDPVECKLNLLQNIEKIQNVVEARLSSLDSQLSELEAMDEDIIDDDEGESCPHTKATVVMLLRDLETVNKVASMP